jgi:hypothetical protein
MQKAVAADGGVAFVPSTVSLRPANQNPYGINYTDCTGNPADAVGPVYLSFAKLILKNFAGSTDSGQVWVSLGDQDCRQDANRKNGVCWPALPDQDKHPGATPSFLSNPINVQDIIGPQHSNSSAYPNPPWSTQPNAPACHTQYNYTQEAFFLYFLPITNMGDFDGTGIPYKYELDVDLVGPPAPALLPVGIGDTLLVANWMPNTDPETAGYDIFIDPFPGQEKGPAPTGTCNAGNGYPPPFDATSEVAASGGSQTGNVCFDPNLQQSILPPMPEAGAPVDAGSSVDASTGDAGDAGDAGVMDANGEGGAADAGSDAADLEGGGDASGVEAGDDGGGAEAGDDASDAEVDSTLPVDSGAAVDSGTAASDAAAIEPGNGGISTVSTTYWLNSSAGMTVTGESVGSYTITGLRNCTPYVFVVSAVDGFGNVGPPSAPGGDSCAAPQSAGDFWQSYRGDGGEAGGYCSLETVGRSPHSLAALALIAGGVALAASRRRRAR